MKILIPILALFLLCSCTDGGDDSKKPIDIPDSLNYGINKPNSTRISDMKINDNVEIKSSENLLMELESKQFVSPDRLFDFFPKSYQSITLDKNSSGKANSGLGKFTTCTGIYKKDSQIIKVRLSDFNDKKYFPDLDILNKIPPSFETFTFEKVKINDEIYGYKQWHTSEMQGILNLIAYNRFNFHIEIENIPDMKNNYKSFIEKFDLKKLKEISNRK